MKKIVLPHFAWPEPDPEDRFTVNEKLTSEAEAELASMRQQCAQVSQDKPQLIDKKPASLDER